MRDAVRKDISMEGAPGAPAVDPVTQLPAIPLTPIPVTGRTGPRPGY